MTRRDPAWQAAFLAALEATAVVAIACKQAGIDRATAYRRRERSDAFAKAWEQALEIAADRLEQEALRRAVTGWEEPVYGTQLAFDKDGKAHKVKGVVGHITRYSDRMLELLLKARRPLVFSERQRLEHSGEIGGAIPYQGDASAFVDAEIIKLATEIKQRAVAEASPAPPAEPAKEPLEPEV